MATWVGGWPGRDKVLGRWLAVTFGGLVNPQACCTSACNLVCVQCGVYTSAVHLGRSRQDMLLGRALPPCHDTAPVTHKTFPIPERPPRLLPPLPPLPFPPTLFVLTGPADLHGPHPGHHHPGPGGAAVRQCAAGAGRPRPPPPGHEQPRRARLHGRADGAATSPCGRHCACPHRHPGAGGGRRRALLHGGAVGPLRHCRCPMGHGGGSAACHTGVMHIAPACASRASAVLHEACVQSVQLGQVLLAFRDLLVFG